MTVGLTFEVSIMGMNQTQDEKQMDQQIEAER